MRQDSDGRDTVFPWSDPPEVEPTYAVGDAIYSGACRGTVVHVSNVVAPLISVVWSDGDGGAIIYPMNASYLRKAMPWE
jgi:hypothetical protein